MSFGMKATDLGKRYGKSLEFSFNGFLMQFDFQLKIFKKIKNEMNENKNETAELLLRTKIAIVTNKTNRIKLKCNMFKFSQ